MSEIHRKQAIVLLLRKRALNFGPSLNVVCLFVFFLLDQFGIVNLTLDNVAHKQLVYTAYSSEVEKRIITNMMEFLNSCTYCLDLCENITTFVLLGIQNIRIE